MLFPILSSLGVFSATYYTSLSNLFVLQSPGAEVNTPILSKDVSWCPGYTLHNLEETTRGLSAHLWLAGPACNAFGQDVTQLTVHVTYETSTRLHVKISDSSEKHFIIPESVIPLHTPSSADWSRDNSDLVFNYDAAPFAFWITRRSIPDALPLFDTRISSLPPTPIPAVIPVDSSTALNGFPLVFEDRYLQLTSALPLNANIYGLGEVVAKSGFRRNTTATVQTMWARDVADPVDENVYGSHPFYLEHRLDKETGKSSSHGVFLFSSAGSDILLLTPPNSKVSLIEYRLLGGIFDFYFFAGPSPAAVTEQYGELIGLPLWQPIWGFGFHLCRWGYKNIEETRLQVEMMRKANVPLEVMWNDIDLYHAVRDFTADPVSYPAEEVSKFVRELESNHQRYIPILDAAVPKPVNKSDFYQPYTDGVERGIFLTNPDGSEYIGQVWPGYTVFPDWFNNATQAWWTDSLKTWFRSGVEFAGLWSDMNEVASFCDGSCGSNVDISNTSAPFILPGDPGNPITDYPECYDPEVFGPSGNMTINGRSTCVHAEKLQDVTHGGSGVEFQVAAIIEEPDAPAYSIHNGFGHLSSHTVSINATHAGGLVELDVHNMWGMMSEKASYNALLEIRKGKRPFQISRSTFPSAGRYTGHWLGDNHSKWSYLYHTIQGVLQFQLFQIPFVGADTCGFAGNSNEDLCSRWMQLSAFTPFYRNHNIRGALPQEPYRWDTVAESSRIAIGVRYQLLPYWYTLFANSSLRGTPPMRALWFEFPEDEELYGVDRQFMIGSDILVTPVLTPDTSFVDGLFPGGGQVTWRDWYTHRAINTTSEQPIRLEAPSTHIPVHIRSGSALLLHAKPGYTIHETRSGPFSLLVSLSKDGAAFGTAYLDDGESYPPGSSTVTQFRAEEGMLQISSKGSFELLQPLDEIVILGVGHQPKKVTVDGLQATWRFEEGKEKLMLYDVRLGLNTGHILEWK